MIDTREYPTCPNRTLARHCRCVRARRHPVSRRRRTARGALRRRLAPRRTAPLDGRVRLARPSRALGIASALAVVYVVWGSTYLGIAVAIETLPPLLMAAARFLLAGALLYAVASRFGDA